MTAARTRTARSSQNAPAASATRSRGILEFIEQDAETWQVVEWFAQLPDDEVGDADFERLHAALTKAETAWRRQRAQHG